MAEDRNDGSIKDILELIKKDPASVSEDKTESGAREFSFKNESAGGLIFESDSEEDLPDIEEPVPEPVAEPKKEKKPAKKPEEIKSPEEEFSLPDSFTVNQKYDTPATPDTPTRIWTTYVPRFTEVSETYRMSDDPRPRPKGQPPRTVMTEAKNTETEPAIEDPTKDLDTEPLDAVVVNLAKPDSADEGESLKVFKFSEREEKPAPPKVHTAEDEHAELKRLVTPEPLPEIKEEISEKESVSEEIPTPEPTESPEEKPFAIPDPEKSDVSVIDYAGNAEAVKYSEANPEGISENDAPLSKKQSGEFTNRLQRDGFKDSFLDSRMSVKIRAIAATVIALMLLALENLYLFEIDVAALLNVEAVPGALAIIDLQFAVCLFVLALPEVVHAVKRLFSGTVLPELMLLPGLAVLIAYTVTVVILAPISYPFYGFIFAVGVLTAIISAHYRITANFTAFKLISRNSEKKFIDKKLTRTLTEENIALDGAVDEYSSLTARLFRAAFITDFFKRTSTSAESSTRTLATLAFSLGAALVVGAVSFFLPGGDLLSAASAFSLVFLFAIPSAGILSHKLTYADSQKRAIADSSTAVGEAAYFDYSGVDVVAFEDTEIFGAEDVNLKRFMLYGDRDSMGKAMKQMSSLFAVVGGPLDNIFKNALEKRCHPASSPIIETDGLSGDVDGRRIAAGTEEYMLRHGIRIPDGAARREVGGIDTTKVMYASENGEVYAKFYIRYSFSEEFTSILPSLKENGIVPLIYTRDPNISNELLKTLTAGADCMRVVKRLLPGTEDDKLYRRVSAGMVTYGDKLSAINMILLSKKYTRTSKLFGKLLTVATAVSAVAAAVISLAVKTPLPSLLFGGIQIALSVAMRIISKLAFAKEKAEKH